MDITTRIQRKLGELNSEHGLLLLFILVATYMFVRAQAWTFNTKVFPQSMAALVIIGSLLVTFQDYLPGPLRKLVAESGAAFGDTEELEELEDEEDGTLGPDEIEMADYGRPLNPVLATAIFITGYAVLGFFFSLLVVSPVFVAVYLVWFRQPWPIVVGLAALALLLAYVFTTLIIVPIDRGTLVGDLLMIRGII
jgi:hypothetical protein